MNVHRFRIGAHIGSGGFGTVENATRVDEGGNVVETGLAQKKLLDKWQHDPDAVARFKREVRMLDEMEHPNILPVLGRNLSDSPPWFIMPKAESSLARELRIHAGDDLWIRKIFAAILEGMAYAHAKRCVHRDLKPENVLIVGGVPMISDFGLGKRLDTNTTNLTMSNVGMGTLAYMAPEQFSDAARVGAPADVYALGKILWEMVTGRPVLVGAPRLDQVPEKYRSFVEKCTEDDPSDRYASASDAQAAFDLLLGTDERISIGQSLEALVRVWEETPLGKDRREAAAVAAYLVARRDDEELYFRNVPVLPRELVLQIMRHRPRDFRVILEAYNGHIQGGLPFDYCDVVANFYRQVFQSTRDTDLRRMILTRLIELGPTHNRWHVGDVVAGLLGGIEDDQTALIAADVIRSDAPHALWFRDYVGGRKLPAAVASAMQAIDPTDNIPV